MRLLTAAAAAALASARFWPPPPPAFLPGVHDVGFVMPFGGAPGGAPCPGDCDALGARDTWVWHDPQDAQWPYKMTYDGSGPLGWLASLAVSNDPTLRTWTKLGSVLKLGAPGAVDGKSASYLTTCRSRLTTRCLRARPRRAGPGRSTPRAAAFFHAARPELS